MLFMDEHDPRFDPSVEETWADSIPGLHWLGILLAAALLLVALTGCEDIERQIQAAEYRDKFYRGCMPRKGDTVTAQWVNGSLICKRITPTGRYGPTFPHAEVTVAKIGDTE